MAWCMFDEMAEPSAMITDPLPRDPDIFRKSTGCHGKVQAGDSDNQPSDGDMIYPDGRLLQQGAVSSY